MITKWKVFNFKSISAETELALGPLTIFAGANSSGKSTFIQSILLVAQTLSHKVGSRSVVLNGALTSLGQFDDLKSNGSESDQITIKCTCEPLSELDRSIIKRSVSSDWSTRFYGLHSNRLREVACEISFDADPSNIQRDLFQIQPRLFATELSCKTRDEENLDQNAYISIRQSNKAIYEIPGVDAVR
jgi:predicted ATP-dependent endonuclease of OLD family